MKYACCAGIEYYDAIAAVGYDAITLPANRIAGCADEAFAAIREKICAGAMPCTALNMFCGPELRLCGTGYDPSAVRAYCRRLARRAQALGVRFIGIGAPKSRSLYDDFNREVALDQFCESLRIADSQFRPVGVETLVEAVCEEECNFIVTSKEAAAVARQVGGIGLVYDVYHAMAMRESPEDFADIKDSVRVLHLAENVNCRRCYLSEAGYANQERYFAQIRQCGFDGECAVEAFADDILDRLASTLSIMKRLGDGARPKEEDQ